MVELLGLLGRLLHQLPDTGLDPFGVIPKCRVKERR
jgi:hypothetical protein